MADWERYSWAESIVREVLSPEKDDLRRQLESAWGVSYYWFPLRKNRPAHTEAFQARYFEEELTHERLQSIMAAHGIVTMFEDRERGEMLEIEVTQFYPNYTGLEGFWFTKRMDWLIYASHERSVTVGGTWLLSAVQEAWPKWKQRVWTTWDYE